MFQPYDEQTASTCDRIAWVLCQIIDDDAPLRWTRYRSAAECIARNGKLMADLQELAGASAQSFVFPTGGASGTGGLTQCDMHDDESS